MDPTTTILTGMGVTMWLSIIIVYVVQSIFLMKLFQKASVAAWKAWVPIVNQYTLVQLGGQKGWMFLLPLVAIFIGAIIMVAGLGTAMADIYTSTSYTMSSSAVMALTGTALVGYMIMMIAAIFMLVIECMAVYNINLKLGWGGGMVVLFIFLGIVWMGIAGLSKNTFDDKKGKPSLAKKVA